MELFIARQPILDRRLRCWGYELLFRSGMENCFRHSDPSQASRSVIANSSLLMDLDNLTQGRKAFYNVTREVLLSGDVAVLPKNRSVIEVMEDIDPDPEVLSACRKLRHAGYTLALDDYTFRESHLPLVDCVSILKIDFLLTTPDDRRFIVERLGGLGLTFLAEKVETQEAFDEATSLGCRYFQGYFFSRPVILQFRELTGMKMQHMRLLREIHRPEIDFDELDRMVRREVGIAYKLLRYVNSAGFGAQREIQSIREALTRLGEQEIRKALSFILLTSVGSDRPEQLIVDSLVRARFSELIGAKTKLAPRANDIFLLGLFSLVDAIVGRPMDEIVRELPIDTDIVSSLLGQHSLLSPVLQYTIAYERADWPMVSSLAQDLGIAELDTPRMYVNAVRWAQGCFEGASATEDRTRKAS